MSRPFFEKGVVEQVNLAKALHLDPRSLQLFRAGLGLVTVIDLLERRPWLAALYGPDGAFPHAVRLGSRYRFFPSAFWASESFTVVQSIHWIALAAALLLLVGVRARLAAAVAFYCVTCLDQRNVYATYGAHDLERILLFWAALLPAGGDAQGPERPKAWFEWAPEWGFLGQVALVYVMAALYKLDEPTWRDGEAVRAALALDPTPGAVTAWLLGMPRLASAATWVTIGVELSSALVFIGPRSRGALSATFILFHILLGAALSLALFSPTSIVMWTALLPAAFWESSARLVPKASSVMERISRFRRRLDPRGPTGPLGERLTNGLALVAFASVLVLSGRSLMSRPARYLNLPADALGLVQQWGMYAGDTAGIAEWVAPKAVLHDGTEVDAWTSAPFDPSYRAFGERAWSPAVYTMRLPDEEASRDFAAWVCKRPEVLRVDILAFRRRVLPAPEPPTVSLASATPCPSR